MVNFMTRWDQDWRVIYQEKKLSCLYLRQFTDGLLVKKLQEKIGKPIFALAKYEKIYRVTIPIGGAGLILITTELDADVIKIVNKILEIKNKYS